MKLSTATLFGSIFVLASIMTVSSCSKRESIEGAWEGNPTRLNPVRYASDASSTITMDFAPDTKDSRTGSVNLSAVISVSQADGNIIPINYDQNYQVNIAATASINGTYVAEDSDDDDYILNLDPSSLQVAIDPSGVSYSTNILSGLQQPILDSLTTQTIEAWRVILTGAIRDEFNKFRKIDDMKVHHKDLLTAEINDRDCTFRRVGALPVQP